MPIINSVIKGKQSIIETLSVTPTTSAQQITAPQGTDGYSPVNVSAVTSSIDANIVAGNIKKDVQILGVTGSYEGTVPTGTKPITSNGVTDVSGYAYADVQVPTTAPDYYVGKTKDSNNKLVTGGDIINLNGISDLSSYCLYYSYYRGINQTVDITLPETVSGDWACGWMFASSSCVTAIIRGAKYITGSNSLDHMFNACGNLTSLTFDSLVSVTQFQGMHQFCNACNKLETLSFPSLKTSGSYSLAQLCNSSGNLKKVYFPSLSSVGSSSFAMAFTFDSKLEDVFFYALNTNSFSTTDCFASMLSSDSNVTVHFPMRIQSTIGSWTDVVNGFGGTNTTVLFDIVTTVVGADTNTYVRKEKDSTQTATAWTYNNTLYYTSGGTEPVVGDTIYSDSACTIAVTTISTIA